MTVYLNGLATALPDHVLPQDLVQSTAKTVLGPRYPDFDRLTKTFASAGIDQRYSVVPVDWFLDEHGWEDRNAAYLDGARRLFVDASRAALENAGWRAEDVDCIVTVSSTGIATPTLEARAASEMGFRDDVRRVPLFGFGCAGGVAGLSVAQSLSAARPDDRVLLVVVEACTLSFRSDRLQKADIIATALFGDGAAAACLSGRASGPACVTLSEGTQKTWPDTLGIMGWDVDEHGLGVIFDRSIPGFVTEHLETAAAEALRATGFDPGDIARFVCHPGGAKVVTAIETALHLEQGSLQAERDILRAAGNMSAPTVLFVLDRVLRDGATGQMMATALGPGFTAAFQPIHVARAA